MNILFSRDLLYPTENLFEPGCVHIEILNPDKKARIPLLIESKSGHSPIKYLDAIVNLIQTDIFDRILIDIKKNVTLYIIPGPELAPDYSGYKFIRVTFGEKAVQYIGIDSIDE